jgi:hypothetical protein
MKITRTQLKRLIKEELLREGFTSNAGTPLTMDQMTKLWDMKDDGSPGTWWATHGPTINASNAGNEEYGLSDSELSELGLSVSDTSDEGEMATHRSDYDPDGVESQLAQELALEDNFDHLSRENLITKIVEAELRGGFKGILDFVFDKDV